MTNKFAREVEASIAKEILFFAKKACSSKTIEASLKLRRQRDGRVEIFSPYYWATAFHDGRGPIRARAGKFLVYFENPSDDPRIRGGYPKFRTRIRKLTQAQFEEGLAINKERRAVGDRPYMIVTKEVGPTRGDNFLNQAFEFLEAADRKSLESIRKEAVKIATVRKSRAKGSIG